MGAEIYQIAVDVYFQMITIVLQVYQNRETYSSLQQWRVLAHLRKKVKMKNLLMMMTKRLTKLIT